MGISRQDIEQLPQNARVAFAARCARLVLPFFERWRSDYQQVKTIRNVVSVAENYNVNPTADAALASAAADRATAIADINAAARPGKRGPRAAANAARAAASAARAAAAASAARIPDVTVAAASAVDAAQAAEDDARVAVDTPFTNPGHPFDYNDEDVSVPLRADYEKILAAAMAQGWTDDTNVPADFFEGPA